jgi:hypothetical protein
VLPWLSAFIGVASATASILWVTRPLPEDDAALVAHVTTAAQPAARATVHRQIAAERAPEAPGVDIGSIPLDAPEAPKGTARAPAHAASGRAAAKPVAEKVTLAEEPEVVLEETLDKPAPDNPYRAAAKPSAPAAKPAAPVTLAEEAPPPAAKAAEGPFNRGVAMGQLSASANRAAACRRPGGQSGSGKATVTFGTDGAAKSVAVSPPFAGTPVGSCVTSAFRSARVPPFTGNPVTLPWSFRIAE